MVLDGNIPVSTIDYICSLAKKHSVPGTSWALKNRFGYWDTSSHNSVSSVCVCVFGCVSVWYEPTDADKACKPFVSESWKALSYTSPNLAELCTINQALCLPTPQGTPCYQPQMVADNWCWNYVLLVPHHIVLVWCSETQTDTKKTKWWLISCISWNAHNQTHSVSANDFWGLCCTQKQPMFAKLNYTKALWNSQIRLVRRCPPTLPITTWLWHSAGSISNYRFIDIYLYL